jgi:predicted nucleic acid-binding protein
MLQSIPPNTRCFIDANIFVYHHIFSPGLSDACTDFLERIERGELPGFTSAVAVAEAVHKVMLAEAIALHGLPHKGLAHYLQSHPQLISSLSKHRDVIETIRALGLHVEPTTLDLLDSAATLSGKYRLLTNDSLTIAAMEKLQLHDLVTNDDNFDSLSVVQVWKPR